MLAHVFGGDRWKPKVPQEGNTVGDLITRVTCVTDCNKVGVLISGDSGTAPTLGYTE